MFIWFSWIGHLKQDFKGIFHSGPPWFLTGIAHAFLENTSITVNIYLVPLLVIAGCLLGKDYGHLNADLLADSAEPHLLFQEELTDHPVREN